MSPSSRGSPPRSRRSHRSTGSRSHAVPRRHLRRCGWRQRRVDRRRRCLRVGPRSAGAEPGPACYGRGGTRATVTDAQVVLGYLGAAGLAGGERVLDRDAALAALERVGAAAGSARRGRGGDAEVVSATMARAIRRVCGARQGRARFRARRLRRRRPAARSALARELDISTVLVPPAPGALAALGLLVASRRATPQSAPGLARPVMGRRVAVDPRRARAEGARDLAAEGIARRRHRRTGRRLPLRRPVARAPGRVPGDRLLRLVEAFPRRAPRRLRVRSPPTTAVEAVDVPCRPAFGPPAGTSRGASRPGGVAAAGRRARVARGGSAFTADTVSAGVASSGRRSSGARSTTWLDDGSSAVVRASGALCVERAVTSSPSTLEVLRHALEGVADEMGGVLRRTAVLAEHQGAGGLLGRGVLRRRAELSRRPSTSRPPRFDAGVRRCGARGVPVLGPADRCCSTTRSRAERA